MRETDGKLRGLGQADPLVDGLSKLWTTTSGWITCNAKTIHNPSTGRSSFSTAESRSKQLIVKGNWSITVFRAPRPLLPRFTGSINQNQIKGAQHMRFSLQREALLKPLQQVVNVVERRQTLPVLANLLVNVEPSCRVHRHRSRGRDGRALRSKTARLANHDPGAQAVRDRARLARRRRKVTSARAANKSP
jgi:hypothetical protein